MLLQIARIFSVLFILSFLFGITERYLVLSESGLIAPEISSLFFVSFYIVGSLFIAAELFNVRN